MLPKEQNMQPSVAYNCVKNEALIYQPYLQLLMEQRHFGGVEAFWPVIDSICAVLEMRSDPEAGVSFIKS